MKIDCCVSRKQAVQEVLEDALGVLLKHLRGSAALCWEMQAEPQIEDLQSSLPWLLHIHHQVLCTKNGHLCVLPQSIAVETGLHQGLLV